MPSQAPGPPLGTAWCSARGAEASKRRSERGEQGWTSEGRCVSVRPRGSLFSPPPPPPRQPTGQGRHAGCQQGHPFRGRCAEPPGTSGSSDSGSWRRVTSCSDSSLRHRFVTSSVLRKGRSPEKLHLLRPQLEQRAVRSRSQAPGSQQAGAPRREPRSSARTRRGAAAAHPAPGLCPRFRVSEVCLLRVPRGTCGQEGWSRAGQRPQRGAHGADGQTDRDAQTVVPGWLMPSENNPQACPRGPSGCRWAGT